MPHHGPAPNYGGPCPCGHDPHGRVPVHTALKQSPSTHLEHDELQLRTSAVCRRPRILHTDGHVNNLLKNCTSRAVPKILGRLGSQRISQRAQLWDQNCVLQNLRLRNLHEPNNRDIDHLIEAPQLRNLFDLPNKLDHGEQPQRHNRRTATTEQPQFSRRQTGTSKTLSKNCTNSRLLHCLDHGTCR